MANEPINMGQLTANQKINHDLFGTFFTSFFFYTLFLLFVLKVVVCVCSEQILEIFATN